jgi:hypothetical protein
MAQEYPTSFKLATQLTSGRDNYQELATARAKATGAESDDVELEMPSSSFIAYISLQPITLLACLL